jgi:hypothetical protein
MADPKEVEKPADEKEDGNGENDKTETPVKAEAEAALPKEETNANGDTANGENGTEDGDAAVADKVEATAKTTSKKGAKKGARPPVKKEEPQSEVQEEGENAPDDKAQTEEIKNEDEPPKEKDAEMKEASTQKKGRKRKSEAIAEGGTSDAPAASSPVKRERRERKSVEAFDPTDFKADRPITVVPGRGVALGDLPRVRASIESAHSFDVAAAYKLIFARSKAGLKKDMVDAILSFSGYLPPLKEGASKTEQHEIDEQYEVRVDDSFTMTCLLLLNA